MAGNERNSQLPVAQPGARPQAAVPGPAPAVAGVPCALGAAVPLATPVAQPATAVQAVPVAAASWAQAAAVPGVVPQAAPAQPQNAPVAAMPVPMAQPILVQPASASATPYAAPVSAKPATTPASAKRRVSPARSAPPKAAKLGPVAQPVPIAQPVPAAQPVPVAASTAAVFDLAAPTIRTDTDEEEEPEEVTEKAVRAAPPWLVSGVVHMMLLILLGVIYLSSNESNKVQIEAIYAETEGVQLEEEILQNPGLMEMPKIKEAALSFDLVKVDDPFAAPPQLDPSLLSDDGLRSVSDLVAPSIGLALTGREKGAKEALLGAYGGNATTEGAVQRGLEWLVRQQNARTGLWSLQGPYADGGGYENVLAATAMALLALQGNGQTHKSGRYQRNVERAADALVKMQDAEGNFFREGGFNHRLYSQAQATIALCELYGMTKDARYRQAAQKALDYAAKAQSPLGGWRYVPREDSDTSVTGWFVMATQSGLMAGLTVQSPTLDGVKKYLDSATTDGSYYSYQAHGEPTLTMTAEALLCRQYLGWPHDDPRLRTGVDYILKNLVDYNEQDLYYWYYATQVLHHMGGKDWDKWNKVMRQVVPEHQVRAGREQGSWDPTNDRWGNHGGRLYTTCLSIYLLEVYYRHLPIYKHHNMPASVLSSASEKNETAPKAGP